MWARKKILKYKFKRKDIFKRKTKKKINRLYFFQKLEKKIEKK